MRISALAPSLAGIGRRMLAVTGALFLAAQVHAASVDDNGESSGYFGGRADGWFWYKDPPPPPKQVDQPAQAVPVSPKAKDEHAALMERFDAYKRRIEAARVRAFLEPTPENFRTWASLQTELVHRVSDAADIWQRTVWANPEFDFTQERPVNRVARKAQKAQQDYARRATMARLAQSNVLFFFFRGDCPHCHAFAPTLAKFATDTGIKVFPISVDGGVLPDFPSPKLDNGISSTLKVSQVPALFLAEPGAARITPVAYGVLSYDDLSDRLNEIANPPSAKIDAATPRKPFNMEELQ